MKRTILMAAIAVIAAAGMGVNASAQERGKFWAGGSLGFGSTQYGTTIYGNSFSIQPEAGYNFSDRWSAGLRLGISVAEIDNAGSHNDVLSFETTPFARYTYLRWRSLALFVDGGATFSTADGSFDTAGVYSNAGVTYGGIFVDPGFSLSLTRRFALVGRVNVFSLGFSHSEAYGSPTFEQTAWAGSLNSPIDIGNITLGFNFRF